MTIYYSCRHLLLLHLSNSCKQLKMASVAVVQALQTCSCCRPCMCLAAAALQLSQLLNSRL
jgi:hypothetical protein